MRFVKDTIGGLAIILVAGVIGIAANAMSDNPATLILEAPKNAAKKSSADHNSPSEADTPSNEAPESKASAAEVSRVPIVTDEEAAEGELTIERVKWLIEAETIVVIDARGVGEYIEGHLPGAINIPYDSFIDYYDKLLEIVPIDADVVAYCRSVDCDLSDNLAQELRLMGYERVLTYRGGIMEWEEAGYPIETPK